MYQKKKLNKEKHKKEKTAAGIVKGVGGIGIVAATIYKHRDAIKPIAKGALEVAKTIIFKG